MLKQISDSAFQVFPDLPSKNKVDGASITDLGDDGAVVEYGPKYESIEGPHYQNLAEILHRSNSNVLDGVGANIVDAIEDDLSSRAEWETALVEGVEQMGLSTDDREWPFKNASGVYSGAFMQSILASVSNITAELLPPNGPVRVHVVGEDSDEAVDQANRVEKWMNLYLTQMSRDFYPDLEQAFVWCTLYGSVFTKTYQDPVLNRPICQYIKPQHFVVNNSASSLENCTRITQILHLTKKELRLRQYQGMYIDLEVFPTDDASEQSQVDMEINRIQGITPGDDDYNQVYTLYECHIDLDLEGYEHKDKGGKKTGIPMPYVVTIDIESKKILSIYKNWVEGDDKFRRVEYFTHFPFFPGLGFYAYGLSHIAGGSAKAATSLLRQLIDAGVLANFPGGFRAKGMNLENSTVRLGPGEFAEIDTNMGPIQQAIMALPYKEPSATLLELKNSLEDNINKLVSAAESTFADFNPNAPVGTTLALMENANKMQNSILRRLHRSMGEVFRIFYRLFSEYLPDKPYPFSVPGGKHMVMRADFNNKLHIIPVSDPNVTSSAQRMIQNEGVMAIADKYPDLFNKRKVVRNVLVSMKVSNIDEIMPPEEDNGPKPLDPISENMNAMNKKPIVANIQQDHQAHIMVHSLLLQNANQDPEIAQTIKAHIQEHMAMAYQLQMQEKMGKQLPEDPSQLDVKHQNKIAAAAAQATQQIMQETQQQQQQQPNPEVMTAQALLEEVRVREKQVDMEGQINQMKLQLENSKLDLQRMQAEQQAQSDMMRLQFEQAKLELSKIQADQKSQFEMAKLQMDQEKIELQAESDERKSETAGFEAELKYQTEQDKINARKEDLDQEELMDKMEEF